MPMPGSGPAVVLGGAASALDELAQARKVWANVTIFAINSAAEHVAADHLVSAHADLLPKMAKAAKGNPLTHTIAAGQGIDRMRDPVADHVWHGIPPGGTSALAAVRIALAMGHRPVALCGCPLSVGAYMNGYRKHEPQGGRVLALAHHPQILEDWRTHWRNAHEAGELAGVVALSGWTRELIGNGKF